jgi:hypothetical protein
VSGVPEVPSAAELAVLPAAELAALLTQAYIVEAAVIGQPI